MKSRFRFHLCCFCIVVFAVAGCKVKRPDDVIPESTMENLLYDYHLAKAMGDNLPYADNYKKALYIDAVFKEYGTTEAVFDSSLVWYARNTETLSKIYEKVSKRLKKQQDQINHLIALRDKKPKMSKRGDSIDVWSWQRLMRLTGEMMNNQYVFSFPVDTNYKERDTLVWTVRYRFLKQTPADSLRTVNMAMQVIYEKDTLNSLTTVTQAGTGQLRLSADTLGAMKEIRGFIFYPTTGVESGALLADRISLFRYHCKDSLTVAQRDSIKRAASLRADSLKIDSLKRVSVQKKDSLQKAEHPDDNHRLSPEEMNRRRTVTPEKRPEQIEVEKRIQQERMEQRRQQQMNRRSRQR